jgi:uncharacterized membrane protein YuzA (DUF378 family)
MKILHMIAFLLLIIGGLNWGLVAFHYNLVQSIFGTGTVASIIYALVGLSALFELFTHWKNCKMCSAKPTQIPPMA